MSDLDKHRVQTDSRHRAADVGNTTRYGEVVNRYLGAVGYRPRDRARPALGLTAQIARR